VFSRAAIGGQEAFSTGFDLFFFNSIFIAGTSVLLALIIGTLASYGFSRYPLRGNDTYLFIILTTRMLPPIVVIIPIFLMFRLSGLSGTYIGIILLYTAFNLPFSIWMIKSFFDELNREVEDAARMDGSSDKTGACGSRCCAQVSKRQNSRAATSSTTGERARFRKRNSRRHLTCIVSTRWRKRSIDWLRPGCWLSSR
jgi:hypothetical protein